MDRIGQRLDDGSFLLSAEPLARGLNRWHRPTWKAPASQWTPKTGITRYEWERRNTPKNQIRFWEDFRSAYLYRGVEPPSPDLVARAESVAEVILPNGMPSLPDDVTRELARCELHRISPDGCWRFQIYAERGGEGADAIIWDCLAVSHRDYRTLPDWDLLVRFRSWILADEREAMILLPRQVEGQLGTYENNRPNSLRMCSPRPRA